MKSQFISLINKTVIASVLFVSFHVYGQQPEVTSENSIKEEKLTVSASFPNGVGALLTYMAEKTKIKRLTKEGRILVSFIIDGEGNVVSAELKSRFPECPQCEEKALKAVLGMPKWSPAQLDGIPQYAYFDLPFVFKQKKKN